MTPTLPLLLVATIVAGILINTIHSLPVNHQPIHSHESPARINEITDLDPKHARRAMNDVRTTITEVQKILESNPNLPRLTRGEIEELFENVTREEFEKSMLQGDHSRAKHMRALMVVLPFNTNDMSDDRLQELYTRTPVTRVVSDDSKLVRPQQIVVPSDHSKGNKATTYKPALITKKTTEPAPTTFHPKSNPIQLAEIISTRIPPVYSSTTSTVTTASLPKSSTTHYHNVRPSEPNLPPPLRPKVKDLLATIGLTAEIMPTPSTQAPPPELTAEMRDLLNSFGLLTNEAPPKHFHFQTGLEAQEEFEPIPSYNFNLDDSFHVDELNPIQTGSDESITQHYRMTTEPELSADDYYAFKPLPIPEEEAIPADMESFFRSYGILDASYRNKKSMFDLPQTYSTSTLKPGHLAMMKDIPEVRVDFLPPNMMSVLGSLGIATGEQYAPSNDFNIPYIPQIEATRRSDDNTDLLKSTTTSDVLPTITATSRSDEVKPTPKEAHKTKKEALPSVHTPKRIDVTTSDLKGIPTISTPVWKPITTNENVDVTPEKVFVVGSTTATKTAKPVTVVLPTPQINNLMDQAVNAKPSRESVVGKVQPMDETAADFAKLQNLLETIRRLDNLNRTLTNEDLDSIDLENFHLSQTLIAKTKGPDPVAETEFHVTKNEVKRQSGEDTSESPLRITLNLGATTEEGILEKDVTTPTRGPFIVTASSATATVDSAVSASQETSIASPSSPTIDVSGIFTTGTSATSTTTTTSTSTSTTTTPKPTLLTNEERKNGLEDSFPGGLDPVDEEPLPPPRRNGFYFFSDWNSFLEVGEDPDKVVVRFDPKVGDSSRFIPVEIPSKSFR